MRAPEGLGGATSGALGCRSGFPPIPAETGREYLSRAPSTVLLRQQVEIVRCQITLATVSERRHPRGCGAASALTTGGLGGILWLAARIAQYSRRFLGEWGTGNGLRNWCPTLTIGKVAGPMANP